jgi:hypothetical protein
MLTFLVAVVSPMQMRFQPGRRTAVGLLTAALVRPRALRLKVA